MPIRTLRFLAAAVLTLVLVAGILPGRALAGGFIGPRAMLMAYYDLINSRDYWFAYERWEDPPQTYADFVAGYAGTTYVAAYFGSYQAHQPNSLTGCIPGVLVGYHTDGSVVAYQGSYDLRYHPQSAGMGQWTIIEGAFSPLNTVPTSERRIYNEMLDVGCVEHGSGIVPPAHFMLMDYISAVNRLEFDKAYRYWTNPRQTYAEFASGWAETTETVLFYGQYQANANLYAAEAGRVPVVMLGHHTDGNMVVYEGCLGVSYNAVAEEHWGLYAAYLDRMPIPPLSAGIITTELNATCY